MLDRIRYYRKGIALAAGLTLLIVVLAFVLIGNPAVLIQDTQLETVLREEIERPEGVIRESDLRRIETLDASGQNIESLAGLEHLTGLQTLDLRDNLISDITPLAGLKQLRELDLRGNLVQELEPLRGLTRLEELNLRENALIDLDPLSGLANLSYLNLHTNPQILTIQPLAVLVSLEILILRNVPVGDDITALADMTRLQRLNLRNSGINSIEVLAGLMAQGALQDRPEEGIEAEVNLLENEFSDHETDPTAPLKPFWPNITNRQPLQLPDL